MNKTREAREHIARLLRGLHIAAASVFPEALHISVVRSDAFGVLFTIAERGDGHFHATLTWDDLEDYGFRAEDYL